MSGFLVAQYQGFADVNMGIGIVITGLGAVLIADAFKIWFGIKKISTQMVWVILGCLLFELILALIYINIKFIIIIEVLSFRSPNLNIATHTQLEY